MRNVLMLLFFQCLGTISCLAAQNASSEEGDIWIFRQEFIKIGKRDIYETLKKGQMQDSSFNSASKKEPNQFVLEVSSDPEYIYLIPVKSCEGVSAYLAQQAAVNKTPAFLSTLNFESSSALAYLSSSSFLPAEANSSELPFVRCFTYSLAPGSGSYFEERLQKMAAAQTQSASPLYWRTWKVMLGTEMPKYWIIFYGRNPQELKDAVEKMGLIDASTKMILRNAWENAAKQRPDLSTPSQKIK